MLAKSSSSRKTLSKIADMVSIGVSHEGLTIDDVLSNSEFYAQQLLEKKVIAFREIEMTHEQHRALLGALSDGGFHKREAQKEAARTRGRSPAPRSVTDHKKSLSAVYGEDFLGAHIINERSHQTLTPEFINGSLDNFFEWSVHIDTPQNEDKSSENLQPYTSMHMLKFEYPETVGRTKFLSLVDLYSRCPEHFKQKLMGSTIEEWKMNKTKLLNLWKPFHVHPYTNEKIMFWPSWWVKFHGKEEPWFDDLVEWVRSYLKDTENWYSWSWRKHDFIMFDNRALVHSFEGGWESEKRIFSQGGLGGLPPTELTSI